MIYAAMNIDLKKPLAQQKKPDFVCEPGDPRVRKFGWTSQNFGGYLSIEGKTIWISSVWSKNPGKGNLSRLIKAIHRNKYTIKVPSPLTKMEAICKHFGMKNEPEYFEQAGETIDVYVLPIKVKTP